jgi:hypothetical protein
VPPRQSNRRLGFGPMPLAPDFTGVPGCWDRVGLLPATITLGCVQLLAAQVYRNSQTLVSKSGVLSTEQGVVTESISQYPYSV